MFALPQGIMGIMRSCALLGGPSLSSVCGLSCRAVASSSNQPSTSSSASSTAPQGKHTVLLEGVASPSWPVQPLQQKLVAKYSPWEITRNLARKSGYQRCACSPCACSAPCMGGCGSRGAGYQPTSGAHAVRHAAHVWTAIPMSVMPQGRPVWVPRILQPWSIVTPQMDHVHLRRSGPPQKCTVIHQ